MSNTEKLVFLHYDVKCLHFTTKTLIIINFLRKLQVDSRIPEVHSMMVIFHFKKIIEFNTETISLNIFSTLKINKYLLCKENILIMKQDCKSITLPVCERLGGHSFTQ